eukprot:5330588-Pyramimonas_sp.AAC.1
MMIAAVLVTMMTITTAGLMATTMLIAPIDDGGVHASMAEVVDGFRRARAAGGARGRPAWCHSTGAAFPLQARKGVRLMPTGSRESPIW